MEKKFNLKKEAKKVLGATLAAGTFFGATGASAEDIKKPETPISQESNQKNTEYYRTSLNSDTDNKNHLLQDIIYNDDRLEELSKVDTDNDGIPDYKDLDWDGDGFSNLIESEQGTDPDDPNDFPQLTQDIKNLNAEIAKLQKSPTIEELREAIRDGIEKERENAENQPQLTVEELEKAIKDGIKNNAPKKPERRRKD